MNVTSEVFERGPDVRECPLCPAWVECRAEFERRVALMLEAE